MTHVQKTRVLVVDDHPLFRAGVAALIDRQPEFAVCGEAGTAVEARVATLRLLPDVVLLDLLLHEGDGLALVRELRHLRPALRVIVLSMLPAATYADRVREAGAAAFLHKETAPDLLIEALRKLAGPAAPVDPESAGPPPESAATRLDRLSDRELQIFQLLGLGRSTREIGVALGVSPRTIEAHRENIKRKLGLTNGSSLLTQAVLWAREQGLLR